MPNRIIKESVCYSESIKSLSWFEEVVFYRLIVNADDYGRLDGRPEMIQAKLFPLRRDITESTVNKALNALTAAGMVQVYMYDQKPFLQLTAWEQHQQVRAAKSKFPAPDNFCNQLISNDFNCNQTISNVPVILSENPYPKRESKASIHEKKFTPPTLEEIRAYCLERKNNVDAKRFYDYFDASNWVDSEGKAVRNWKQKIITWEGTRNGTNKPVSESAGRTEGEGKPKYGFSPD